MAKRKDIAGQTAATETAPATQAPAAKDAPLPVETPTIASVLEAAPEASTIDLSMIGPIQPNAADRAPPDAAGNEIKDEATPAVAPQAEAPKLRPLPRHALLAASIALAVALGALGGAAVTSGLSRDAASPDTAIADATRALQHSVAQLDGELGALKTRIDAGHRNANTQFGRLADRLERAEKAQAEPAAKLAKIAETIDRLERRPAVAAVAAPEVTGAVPAKQESKPPVAEGWRLRDFYAGRAVVESSNGRLFEVGPGSNLPGLGRVETVKREDGRVVVVTRNGIIAGSFEQRRPPYYPPYRY